MDTLVGLDIGSHNIKLIELARDRKAKTYTLLSAGSMPTPRNNSSAPVDVDENSTIHIVKELIKETGCKCTDVALALPEAQVFTRVIEMPPLSQKELMSAIKWEAEQYIPLPLDQVNVDYTILRTEKETSTGKIDILLVAAPKTLIDRYLRIVDAAGLTPVAAETEIIAASRAFVRTVPTLKHVLIVSIGAQTTDIAITKNGVLLFTRSISSGGDAISRSLMQSLDFTMIQAEEYKKTYGLNQTILEGKIFTAIKPVINTIIEEIRRAIGFFEEHQKEDRIEAIILSGGSAKLPGLVPFFTQNLAIETQLGNPWLGIQKDLRFQILDTEGPLFGVSVGLAIRE